MEGESYGDLKREDTPGSSLLGICESEWTGKSHCVIARDIEDWIENPEDPEFNKNSQLMVSPFVSFSHMISGIEAGGWS